MKIYLYPIIGLSFALMAGCASQPSHQQSLAAINVKENNYSASIKNQLVMSSQSIDASLHNLSMLRIAQYPGVKTIPFKDITAPDLCDGKVSLKWYGPINIITRKMALAEGYQYQQFGKPPALPVLVNLEEKWRSPLDIFRDIDVQANNKASIEIFPNQKIISLRYL